jgi:hypothetical protein
MICVKLELSFFFSGSVRGVISIGASADSKLIDI